MSVDLNNLNQKQLNDVINQAENKKKEIRQQRIADLRKRVNDMIKAEGYSFEDVFGSRRKNNRSTGKVPPKYFNPKNPEQTWSGRGKRPHWFNDALNQGKQKDDMLIK